MLIPHQFDQECHIYRTDFEYTLATSDVLEANGLSDFNQVPPEALVMAGHRGSATHLAIEYIEGGKGTPEEAVAAYEEKEGCSVLEKVTERLEAYSRFRKGHPVRLAGKMEQSRVYRHVGTEALIGATADMPCFLSCECGNKNCALAGWKDVLAVVDPKTCHKQYGEKAKQLRLKWLAQTQSYTEALEADDDFWSDLKIRPRKIEKVILHLHPQCGKIRGSEPTGFEVHWFKEDAQFLWDSLIRVAQAKLSHGYKLNRYLPKTQEMPLGFGNGKYEAPEDCPF